MNNEPTSSNSQTDRQRLDAMTDEDIDFSDCLEITPEMFAKAVVRRGLPAEKCIKSLPGLCHYKRCRLHVPNLQL